MTQNHIITWRQQIIFLKYDNEATETNITVKFGIPYGGKLWRVQTLAKGLGKHYWRNKLWQIDDESLIKCILKQFNHTSTPNLSIVYAHVFVHTCCL